MNYNSGKKETTQKKKKKRHAYNWGNKEKKNQNRQAESAKDTCPYVKHRHREEQMLLEYFNLLTMAFNYRAFIIIIRVK